MADASSTAGRSTSRTGGSDVPPRLVADVIGLLADADDPVGADVAVVGAGHGDTAARGRTVRRDGAARGADTAAQRPAAAEPAGSTGA